MVGGGQNVKRVIVPRILDRWHELLRPHSARKFLRIRLFGHSGCRALAATAPAAPAGQCGPLVPRTTPTCGDADAASGGA